MVEDTLCHIAVPHIQKGFALVNIKLKVRNSPKDTVIGRHAQKESIMVAIIILLKPAPLKISERQEMPLLGALGVLSCVCKV